MVLVIVQRCKQQRATPDHIALLLIHWCTFQTHSLQCAHARPQITTEYTNLLLGAGERHLGAGNLQKPSASTAMLVCSPQADVKADESFFFFKGCLSYHPHALEHSHHALGLEPHQFHQPALGLVRLERETCSIRAHLHILRMTQRARRA